MRQKILRFICMISGMTREIFLRTCIKPEGEGHTGEQMVVRPPQRPAAPDGGCTQADNAPACLRRPGKEKFRLPQKKQWVPAESLRGGGFHFYDSAGERWEVAMGKRSINTVFGGAGFYIALLLCVAAIGVGGYFALFHTPSEETAGDTDQETVSTAENPEHVVPPEVPETVVQTVDPVEEIPREETPVSKPVIDDTPVAAAPPQLVVTPVDGETVAAFSVSELMFDQTMGDWRTHDGIDIQADEGTKVLAAAAGTVNTVYEDAVLGNVVVIDHDDGYQTLYASLQSKPAVSAGDQVTAGQVIGSVGSTAASEADRGAHLHFSVTKDGEPVDPDAYLNGTNN